MRGTEKKSHTTNRAKPPPITYILMSLAILSLFYPFSHQELIIWAMILLWLGLISLLFTRPSSLPEVKSLIELAHKHQNKAQYPQAERYFCQAIYLLVSQKEFSKASELFEEYFMRYRRIFSPRIQLELCRHLSQRGKYLLSARALEILIKDWDKVYNSHQKSLLEQAYLYLARIYGEKLDLPSLAIDLYFAFLKKFPRSPYRETALYQLQILDQKYKLAV